jgi:bis(5'-nucleosyl)-tetraphosphatase (symmetrical)
MVHAGLVPQWDLDEAQSLANEVEKVLRSHNYPDFFPHMYGDQPRRWEPELAGWDRLRFIINVFTRIRYCDENGKLDLKEKRAPSEVVAPTKPWFKFNGRRSADETILFGHWSTLGFVKSDNIVCLDSGCLWGGSLTAIRLDRPDLPATHVDCEQQQAFD